jgi:Lon protease-like protein
VDRAPDAVVPVFPLPDLVVFPRVLVPLHVFELRYRTMVRDALSRGRELALATLCPGYEPEYHGSPAFEPLGCLVRIEEVEWLPNDHYDLRVAGTARVRFRRIVKEFPYRGALIDPLPEHPYSEDDPIVTLEKQALLEQYVSLRDRFLARGAVPAAEERSGAERLGETLVQRVRQLEALLRQSPPVLGEDDPFETIVNTACAWCQGTRDERLALLAQDGLVERGMLARTLIERALGAPPPKAEPGPSAGGERN